MKPKPHPKPHPHPIHSGDVYDNPYFMFTEHSHRHYHAAGAAQDALRAVLAALRSLPTRDDVEGVLSLALAALVHEHKMGLMRTLGQTMTRINHYGVEIETRKH